MIHTYRVTYENVTESKKSPIKGVQIFQYCTIKAKDMAQALEIFNNTFVWEAVKVQKIN
jgi:hypothetical protein